MLDAVYGEDDSASALDKRLEQIQILSLRPDEEW